MVMIIMVKTMEKVTKMGMMKAVDVYWMLAMVIIVMTVVMVMKMTLLMAINYRCALYGEQAPWPGFLLPIITPKPSFQDKRGFLRK